MVAGRERADNVNIVELDATQSPSNAIATEAELTGVVISPVTDSGDGEVDGQGCFSVWSLRPPIRRPRISAPQQRQWVTATALYGSHSKVGCR
jgi:hypothetical protein